MPWSTEQIQTLSTHQLWWVIDDSDDDVHDGDDHDSGDDDKDDGIDYDSSDDVIDGGDVVDLFLTVYSSDGPRPTQPSLHCHPGQITPTTSWARSKSPPKNITNYWTGSDGTHSGRLLADGVGTGQCCPCYALKVPHLNISRLLWCS